MAKRGNETAAASDKAKVRVFFAEVEGNNESVQEALKIMVSAMSRPVRLISGKSIGETPALISDADGLSGEEDVVDSDAVDLTDRDEEVAARRPRESGPKRDRNLGITLVSDLNFRPSGHANLRDFFSEKAPNGDMEEILVVTFYMQHMMEQQKIGPGHIKTALKDVGKGIPLDLRQTIRNMKSKKAWVNYSTLDDISVATAGENFVQHDMPGKS